MPRIPRPLLLAALVLPLAAYVIFRDPAGPEGVYEDARDQARLSDIPELKHLSASMNGSDLRASDLVRGEALSFHRPPDPTAYLNQTRRANLEMQPNPGAAPLSILTYNLGLLDRRKILNTIGRVKVPEIEHRRKAMADAIFERQFDVYLLQEVWEDADAEMLLHEGKKRGYTAYMGSEEHHSEHGLLILIRTEWMAGSADIQMGEYQYKAQYDLEFWPGPGIRRGLLWLSLVHPKLGPIRLVDTHLSAFPDHWLVRIRQARELALHVDSNEDTLLFVGGDMNAGPFYPRDTWVGPDGASQEGWFNNAISYGLLLHYLGGKDLFVMGSDPMDIALGKNIIPDEKALLERPLGVEGYCERTPHLAFTATDCNSLYFQNYGGTEYPARLDHLFVRDRHNRVRVQDAKIIFTEKMDLGGTHPFELSDHYGVVAHIEIAALENIQPSAP